MTHLWTEKLRKLIPEEEMQKVLESPFCEVDNDYLGFTEVYGNLAEIIPKDKVILDLGCYAGLQGYFFRDHKGYIGIDECPMESKYPKPEHQPFWYVSKNMPVPDSCQYYNSLENFFVPRANCPNSTYVVSKIQDYIKGLTEDELKWINGNCFAIMSFVPDKEAFDMAKAVFDNFAWYYGDNLYGQDKIRYEGKEYDFRLDRNEMLINPPVLEYTDKEAELER